MHNDKRPPLNAEQPWSLVFMLIGLGNSWTKFQVRLPSIMTLNEPDSLSFLTQMAKLLSHSAHGGHSTYCKIEWPAKLLAVTAWCLYLLIGLGDSWIKFQVSLPSIMTLNEPDSLNFLTLMAKLLRHSALGGHSTYCKIEWPANLLALTAWWQTTYCLCCVDERGFKPSYMRETVKTTREV